MKVPIKLEIPRRSRTCSKGEEPFKAGMDYFSALREGVEEVYQRLDFCPKCWNHETEQNSVVHWKSKVPQRKNAPATTEEYEEQAFSLLREAMSQEGVDFAAEAFVLALYLQRRKKLVQRQDLEEHILYEVIDTEEMLAIKRVTLSQIQTAQMQTNLARKLSQGMEDAAPSP